MKRCIRSFIAFCLLVEMLTISLPSFSQTTNKPKTSLLVETSEGLTVARIVTLQGIVRINFPDDMAAGDTISGTVSTEPAGSNEAEKAQNLSILNGYVIDLGDGNKVKADKPMFTWEPHVPIQATKKPTAKKSARYLLMLVEALAPDGTSAGTADIPILAVQPPTPSSIDIPSLAQTGHPLMIASIFDGNLSNTGCTIGGQPTQVIAESPRKSIVKIPTGMIGPVPITINEGASQASGTIRVVGVNLSVPKTNLTKGEQTTLTVRVNGLQGVTTPVPLQIVTTGTVNMQGGNTQNIQIQPGRVEPSGNYSQTFELTGTQAGGFKITALVTGPIILPPPKGEPCTCFGTFLTETNPISITITGSQWSFKPNMTMYNSGPCNNHYRWTVTPLDTPLERNVKFTILSNSDKSEELVLVKPSYGKVEISVNVSTTCPSTNLTWSTNGKKTFNLVTRGDAKGATVNF